ncbi:metallophosphoesterase [Deinococcus radiophilus]|uniref:Phosphohydrolase n=1 Tax=Deinococcus radiophilus TaxID=32062 RepID=A0A431VRW5_9DEIO|nr:metallophosphoesterase [Deinococcus radiophilus]RTR25935.1 phosphohydrolase [Deinococcus radiophilus]UFA49703.1 metallophosphoesterase [Deinococcus radiophilus]
MLGRVRVFALADLHLSAVTPKPMTIFGPGWAGHPGVIWEHWAATIQDTDLVLLPGDLSWAMTLDDALVDLEMVAQMPGEKVILRGNHDYWWSSVSKLRSRLPARMHAIQHDALRFGPPGAGVVVCGTRGWDTPGHLPLDAQDAKILSREAERLRLSLAAAARLRQPGDRLILMLHYPPASPPFQPNVLTPVLQDSGADLIVFGHLHGVPEGRTVSQVGGIPAHLVAADALGCVPRLLLELPEAAATPASV